MRTLYKLQLVLSIATLIASLPAQAYPGESIALDPVTGNYTITYRSSDEDTTNLMQTVFVPSTKVVPSIRSSFRVGERDVITYRYTVSNGATAKQAIVGVLLEQIVNPVIGELPFPHGSTDMAAFNAHTAATKAAVATPPNWHGNIFHSHNEYESLDRIYWMPNSGIMKTGGIQAGRTLSGFGFASLDLPGMSSAHMDGIGAVFGYPDEGPAEDSAVLAELNRLRDNDFVARPAAVPMVAVPIPFDAAILIERIQTQMHGWIAMQLLDATFSSQLDRYLTAAADAYRHNQPKAGKEHIQTLRKMLKKEHEDADKDDEKEDKYEGKSDNRNKYIPIDRLAARVLDFDLKYALKRIGDD